MSSITESNHILNPATDHLPCKHCGLNIKAGCEIVDNGNSFCCSGCKTVFSVLNGAGLGRYYSIKEKDDSYTPTPVSIIGQEYTYLDDPSFQSKYLIESNNNKKTFRLNAFCEGIHCTACIWILEKLPEIEPALLKLNVDYPNKTLDLHFDSEITPLSKIATLLDSFGYAPQILDPNRVKQKEKGIGKDLLLRLGVAAVSAGNIMMLSVSLYQGDFSASEIMIERVFGWGSFLLAIPAVFFSALPFIRGAWSGLKAGIIHLDLPLATGILSGFFLSAYNIIFESGEIYFDSIAVLIFLLLCGRVLQEQSLSKIDFSTGLAKSLIPDAANRILKNGSKNQIFVGSLKKGDHIYVDQDKVIPVDGVLQSSATSLDLAILTGEAVPVDVKVGEPVWAGTKVVGEPAIISVEKTGPETRIGSLLSQIEEKIATEHSSSTAGMENISKRFVGVLFIATIFTIIFYAHTGVDSVINRLLALFVVTCPCALGLAHPLTFTMAIYRAAKAGIIIKGGKVISNITKIKGIFFDKTATLTTGEMLVTNLFLPKKITNSNNYEVANIDIERKDSASLSMVFNHDLNKLLCISKELEVNTHHPIARAIIAFVDEHVKYKKKTLQDTTLTSISSISGGRAGRADDGSEWWISTLDDKAAEKIVINSGPTLIGLYKDNSLQLAYAIGDSLRSESKKVIKFFKDRGLSVYLLSGDNQKAADLFGTAAGINPKNIYGGFSPEQKGSLIKDYNFKRPCSMIGDGANDTAALSEATVGIGIHGGAEACLKVGDVYLSKAGISPLIDLWQGSFRTISTLRRSIVLSLIYNFTTGLLAILGIIGPLEAAVLMPISSIAVITIATRSRTF